MLGFEPGEGPFHIKGTAYIFHYRWAQEFLPGGVEAQLQALGPLGEHPFFRQIFIGGTMYDLFPLVALGYACGSLRGESLVEFVRMRARYQAEQDLRHIRKWLVKIASPTVVAKRFPSILTSYFDFGEAETEHADKGVRGYVRGVPEIIGSWMIATCDGFASHALEVNGAHDIRFGGRTVALGKRDRGFPLCDLEFDFRWS